MSHLDYEINKELGECYLFMGELDKAEDYYKKAAGSNGVHPDPYIGLATIAVQRGEYDSAMQLYQKAHAVEVNDKSFAGMGLIQMETSRQEEAFDNFSEALRINASNMVALFGIIRIGHEAERVAEAAPFLEKFLEIDPAKHEVRYSLAGLYICMDKKDEAVQQLEMILEMDPANAAAKELLEQI
ncbi:tetratricopeptide repeat protein [Maridesulfovibrio zosterae]|uniref:tetratricopeptide repeat protein n=1 Tax=Maridesulfovibrio zosterae TaxID=82171 RepID=UPI00040E6121|nr:tetratricopeptide repeat protein [Maridesulfovibrio zosterae]